MTAAPPYALLISKTLQNQRSHRAEVVSFLAKSAQYKDIILYVIREQKGPTLQGNYEALFAFVIEMLAEKENSLKLFDYEQLKPILRLIIDYPIQSTDIRFNDKLIMVLQQLFKQIPDAKTEEIVKFITDPPATYSFFCLSIFSSIKKSIVDETFIKILNNFNIQSIPSINALIAFWTDHIIKELNTTTQGMYNEFGGDEKIINTIKPLLISDATQQRIAYRLIKAGFHFLEPNSAFEIFLAVCPSIINILHKVADSMRIDIASVFAELPAINTVEHYNLEEQLKTHLRDLAQHIYAGDNLYCTEVIRFVEPRKDVANFKTIIADLFKSIDTAMGGIILAIHFDLAFTEANIKNMCFSKDVKPAVAFGIMSGISYTIAHKKINDSMLMAIIEPVFSILSNQTILSDVNLRPSVFIMIGQFISFYKQYTGIIVEKLLNNMKLVSDQEVIACMAGEIEKVLPEAKNSVIPAPDKKLFTEYFVHLLPFFIKKPSGLVEFSTYLRVFRPSQAVPQTWTKLFDNFISEVYAQDIKSALIAKAKTSPQLVIPIAYLQNLSASDISDLIQIVTSTEVLGPKKEKQIDMQLFIDFFAALSERYFSNCLEELNQISMQKKKKTFLFIGHDKKTIEYSVRMATVAAVSKILAPKPGMTPQQQEMVYNILNHSLPTEKNMTMFASEIEKLSDVFPQLSSAICPVDLVERAAPIPLFAPYLIHMIANQKNVGKLADTIIQSWLFHLDNFVSDRSMNQHMTALLFRINPDQKTLKTCLVETSKHFTKTDPLSFISFAYECAVEACNRNIAVPKQDLGVILYNTAPLCLSNIRVTRAVAFRALMAIFGINVKENNNNQKENPSMKNFKDPLAEIDQELSFDALSTSAVSLFARVLLSQNLEFCQQLCEQISKSKTCSLPSAMIIRAAVGIHGPALFTASPATFKWMIDSANSSNNSEQIKYHLNTAISGFAQTNMAAAISLIMLADSMEVRKMLVSLIVMSESRRMLFIKEYNALLMAGSALSFFHFIPTLLEYYTVEDNLGLFFSCVMMWLGALNSQHKQMSSREIKDSRQEILLTIEKIFEHTVVGKLGKDSISIEFSTFEALEATINKIAEMLALLDSDSIFKICASVGELLASKNEVYKVTSACLYASLFSSFGKCTNSTSVQLTAKLSECLAIAFKSSSNDSRRFLAFTFDKRIPFAISGGIRTEHATTIFISVLESLTTESKFALAASVSVLSTLVGKMIKGQMKENADFYINALKNVLNQMEFSMQILELIEAYLEIRCTFNEFASKNKLNLSLFVDLLSNERADVRNRANAIIKKLLTGVTPQSLNTLMPTRELIVFATDVVQRIKAIYATPELIDFIMNCLSVIGNDNSQESAKLRDISLTLAVELMGSGPLNDKADKLLKFLVP